MPTGMKILAAGLVAVALASALYLRTLVRQLSEVPYLPTGEARVQLKESILESAPGEPQTVSLFFPVPGEGMLRREDRTLTLVSATPDRVRQILMALREGSREGLEGAIPAETEIRAVYLAPDGIAYVDFDETFERAVSPGIRSETLTIYAIVNTLAVNLPSIQQVRILLEGREAETLAGHADLSRAYTPDPSWVEPTPANLDR